MHTTIYTSPGLILTRPLVVLGLLCLPTARPNDEVPPAKNLTTNPRSKKTGTSPLVFSKSENRYLLICVYNVPYHLSHLFKQLQPLVIHFYPSSSGFCQANHIFLP